MYILYVLYVLPYALCFKFCDILSFLAICTCTCVTECDTKSIELANQASKTVTQRGFMVFISFGVSVSIAKSLLGTLYYAVYAPTPALERPGAKASCHTSFGVSMPIARPLPCVT